MKLLQKLSFIVSLGNSSLDGSPSQPVFPGQTRRIPSPSPNPTPTGTPTPPPLVKGMLLFPKILPPIVASTFRHNSRKILTKANLF